MQRISELESRIARLEKVFLGSSEPAPSLHPPVRPSPPPSPPPNNNEMAFPQLNAELLEEEPRPRAAAVVNNSIKPATKPTIIYSTDARSALETIFPNIATNITLVWGSPECKDYLNKLMIDSRGDRQGFDMDIMSELMLLAAIMEHEHTDKWQDYLQTGDRR